VPKRPKHLYHFTNRFSWRFIETEGIRYGEVPVNLRKTLYFPSMSSDPNPEKQGWARMPPTTDDDGPVFIPTNKRAVRITIALPMRDSRLVRWVDLTKRWNMEPQWFKAICDSAGGGERNWWIYQGIIRPDRFQAVDFLDSGAILHSEAVLMAMTQTARTSQEAFRILGIDQNGQ
jgi:hypothetical protein